MLAMSTAVTKNGTRAKMEFITWLENEMESRRWTKSDLMRASGLSHSMISLVLSGDKGVGPDFCNGVARAFGIPPEEVFRKAGLLPALPGPEDDKLANRLVENFKRLSIEKRREVLEYVMWKIQESRTQDTPGLDSSEANQSS